MLKTIQAYISKHNLLTREGKHLVALSGGADSVALLLILKELGYNVDAMHCNFHLRGEESDRDENFCKEICATTGTELHIAHFNTIEFCRMNHVSIEMGARNLRYDYFHKLRHDLNAESICVAHHKNDTAETLLMNIIRGTGVTGLTAIRPKNGAIIRPLLCISRNEIEEYLKERHQGYVTDSSNLVNDITRNKIRLDIMPILHEINPSVIDAISNTAEHMWQAMPLIDESTRYYENKVKEDTEYGISINLHKLMQTPAPQHILYSLLSQYDISSSMIKQIYDNINAQTGKIWETENITIATNRGRLLVEKRLDAVNSITIPVVGTYNINNGHKLTVSIEEIHGGIQIDTSPNTALLDAATIKFPLLLRKTMPNDRFIPLGMKGKKLVSDFLTDRKLSILQKKRQLCVIDSTGQIIWLVNHRINNTNRITDRTIKIVRLRYTGEAKSEK